MIAVLALLAAAAEPVDPFIGLPDLQIPVVEPVEPVEGECDRAFDLVAGKPPPEGLIGPDGLVVCTATAVPVSEGLTVLAQADAFAQLADEVPLVVRSWRREATYWHTATLEARRPPPLWARPGAQRWIGRAEGYGTVAIGVALVVVLSPLVRASEP